uniref:Probable membrane transporter protein n=1 Tax=Fervidicoccus fontis TaxID=683846 RepID=A0A7C1IG58_9CREN
MNILVLNIATLVAIGLGAGFLGSLSGLGGASIITPILVGLGVPVKTAIANSVVTIVATSAGSSASYLRDHYTNIRAAMYLELFTIMGGIIGASIAVLVPSWMLYFFFAFFLLSSLLIREKIKPKEEGSIDKLTAILKIHGRYWENGRLREYVGRNTAIGGPLMIIAGLAAGALGIGAGAFKTTIMEGVIGLPVKVSSATSNFIIGMTGLAAATVYVKTGLVDPFIVGPLILGTSIGSIIGSRILGKISDKKAKMVSVALTLYIILQMLIKGAQAI